jgi:hypothetical protein
MRERLVRLGGAAWAASLGVSVAAFASDPGRDAWIQSFQTQHAARPATASERLTSALGQFSEGLAYVELVLALAIAAGCSMILAWTPVAHARKDAADILESKKILVALGVVGAVVAGLVTVNPAMGLVIFGIGGLIRFRTVLEHPRLTAKAILCVLVGLAAGLNQFVTAGLVTVAGFLIVWWIERSTTLRLRVKLPSHGAADRAAVMAAIDETLRQSNCKPRKVAPVGTGRNVIAIAAAPSSLDTDELADRLGRTLVQVTGQAVEVEARLAE